MILNLAYFGNPILRKKAKPVEALTEEVLQLIADMKETVLDHEALGLAAPQVKRSLRIFLMCPPIEVSGQKRMDLGPPEVFINPKILSFSEETDVEGEGCLSIPGVIADIERPIEIEIEAMNEKGEIFTRVLQGLSARCFLHENDHVNGVLSIDRVKGRARKALDSQLREIKKKYN